MKHRVVFRADGGTSIGMGHVVRTLALADMLVNDFEIVFAVQQTDDKILRNIGSLTDQVVILPKTEDYNADANNFVSHLQPGDLVVLDGYNFRTNYQQTIREKGCRLVCIDDLHQWHHVAHVIINYAHGVDERMYDAEPYTRFCFGLDYVLLRKEFLKISPSRHIVFCRKAFISMGAADEGNISMKVAQALVNIREITEIHLMVGGINPHLKELEKFGKEQGAVKVNMHVDISPNELKGLLVKCDLAICPASTISLECCATGIVLISGYTAENQMGILNGLQKYDAAINAGNLNTVSEEALTNMIKKCFQDPQLLSEMLANQERMIDGKSPQRMKELFLKLADEKLYFRFATPSDVDLYFHWANDETVRNNSYNRGKVDYDDHIKWFHAKLNSDDCSLYVFYNSSLQPVGQVRIEKKDGDSIIGISIAAEYRGRSHGVEMLEKASAEFLKRNKGSVITALIKVNNIASLSIFRKAGFVNESIIDIYNEKSYKLQRMI